jgi:hypothetical protein
MLLAGLNSILYSCAYEVSESGDRLDTANITSGVIISAIGQRRVLEDIISLTDVRSAADFRTSISVEGVNPAGRRHLDFYFEFPTGTTTSQGIFRHLPLSGVIKGTTTLPQQKACLNDNRAIQGACEVSYWIEARFRLAGAEVGFLTQHVQVTSLYPRLRVALARSSSLSFKGKPALLSRCKLQKFPSLELTVFDVADEDPESSAQPGKRRVRIPLVVRMDRQNATSTQTRQSLKCDVEAKMEIRTRFSVLPQSKRLDAGDSIPKTTTMSNSKSTILFRPLPRYDERVLDSADPYLATSELLLDLPERLSQPSMEWKYLSRSYTISLNLRFRSTQGAPGYNVLANVPILVIAQGSSDNDTIKEDVTVDISETTAELDQDDEVLDMLNAMAISERHARPQLLRAGSRTPPPAYFR